MTYSEWIFKVENSFLSPYFFQIKLIRKIVNWRRNISQSRIHFNDRNYSSISSPQTNEWRTILEHRLGSSLFEFHWISIWIHSILRIKGEIVEKVRSNSIWSHSKYTYFLRVLNSKTVEYISIYFERIYIYVYSKHTLLSWILCIQCIQTLYTLLCCVFINLFAQMI